jgi:hypothetical protein
MSLIYAILLSVLNEVFVLGMTTLNWSRQMFDFWRGKKVTIFMNLKHHCSNCHINVFYSIYQSKFLPICISCHLLVQITNDTIRGLLRLTPIWERSRAFHGFGLYKFPYGGLVLRSSQFSILSQLTPKILLDSKVATIDPKNNHLTLLIKIRDTLCRMSILENFHENL